MMIMEKVTVRVGIRVRVSVIGLLDGIIIDHRIATDTRKVDMPLLCNTAHMTILH